MNQAEKIRLYKSQDYYDRVEMQLFQWLNYWVSVGVEEITDPDPEKQEKLRSDTSKVMDMLLVNPDRVVKKVMILAIQHETMGLIAEITEPDLKNIIDNIMSRNLSFIIGDGTYY